MLKDYKVTQYDTLKSQKYNFPYSVIPSNHQKNFNGKQIKFGVKVKYPKLKPGKPVLMKSNYIYNLSSPPLQGWWYQTKSHHIQGGAKVDLRLWNHKTQTILVVSFISYYMIFHTNNCKPTLKIAKKRMRHYVLINVTMFLWM